MVNVDDIRRRWYAGETVSGVVFGLNDGVVAPPGRVNEDLASVISVVSVEPQVSYLIERSDGSDQIVNQSELALLIYVAMINEGTNVWRPVAAKPVAERTARIVTPCPEGETWEFSPGALVVYEEQELEGCKSFVAKRSAGDAA